MRGRVRRKTEIFHPRLTEQERRQNEQDNRQALEAAYLDKRECRFRVQVGVYGPGTQENRKSRYWWMLGESVTVAAIDVEDGQRFLRDLKVFLETWR